MGTRCFGYSIPELSMVPFADNCNHQTIDNQYEMFNSRIHNKALAEGEDTLTEQEKLYMT